MYVGVPRDRDQAFYVNQGVAPWYASLPWVVPNLQGFSEDIKHSKFSLMQHAFLVSRTFSHLPEEEWMKITDDFVKSVSDQVIDDAMKRLPRVGYSRCFIVHIDFLRSINNVKYLVTVIANQS